jgi:hypothetical protein
LEEQSKRYLFSFQNIDAAAMGEICRQGMMSFSALYIRDFYGQFVGMSSATNCILLDAYLNLLVVAMLNAAPKSQHWIITKC